MRVKYHTFDDNCPSLVDAGAVTYDDEDRCVLITPLNPGLSDIVIDNVEPVTYENVMEILFVNGTVDVTDFRNQTHYEDDEICG